MKELAVASRQRTISHFIFTREFFNRNNTTFVTHPPYFFLFPRLKIELRGGHFDTIEVIEAKSQDVLNALTEHDFHNAFKIWQKHWERCLCVEEGYFEVDGDQ
jgi:hypothetical protein